MKTEKGGCILINLEKKEIALVYRENLNDYTFPKGHMEKGETIQQCAVRETIEETGHDCHLYTDKEISTICYVTPSGEEVINYYYVAIDDGLTDKIIKEEDKEILIWKSIEEVYEILSYDNLKDMWKEIKPEIEKIK